ncbi:lysophospholipid acyltransferase family protein [Aliikangiella coralliicola]|uniref:Acyltransferase n=1 Tax=Aliikangiella coralliicola TaxID=2592383 RepID=A0A545UCZ3_9GAMM|nr:lysophospholipid acyltransferase family protein [Aliikangiella coralliicola]TQV87339.1 acyltransferase [Aliikangiella coralliicola]
MLAWLSRKILVLRGWTLIGQPPALNQYVAIVAPHTSNWDFFLFLLMKFSFRLKVSFIGKHTIFVWPIGWALRRLGGIPVNRSAKHNVVDTIVEAFNQNEKMIFAISPEGTRSYKDHWKSGFYHIALSAGVPVQTCFLDTTKKQIGFGPLVTLTGDKSKDLDEFQEIYHNKKGIKPELFSQIQFK